MASAKHRSTFQERQYAKYLNTLESRATHETADFMRGGAYGLSAETRASVSEIEAFTSHRKEKPTRRRGASALSSAFGRTVRPT